MFKFMQFRPKHKFTSVAEHLIKGLENGSILLPGKEKHSSVPTLIEPIEDINRSEEIIPSDTAYADKSPICRHCGQSFAFNADEQRFCRKGIHHRV